MQDLVTFPLSIPPRAVRMILNAMMRSVHSLTVVTVTSRLKISHCQATVGHVVNTVSITNVLKDGELAREEHILLLMDR